MFDAGSGPPECPVGTSQTCDMAYPGSFQRLRRPTRRRPATGRPAGHIRLPGRADPVPDNQQIESERVLAFECDCRLGVLQGEIHAQWSVGADAYDDFLAFVNYFVNPCWLSGNGVGAADCRRTSRFLRFLVNECQDDVDGAIVEDEVTSVKPVTCSVLPSGVSMNPEASTKPPVLRSERDSPMRCSHRPHHCTRLGTPPRQRAGQWQRLEKRSKRQRPRRRQRWHARAWPASCGSRTARNNFKRSRSSGPAATSMCP